MFLMMMGGFLATIFMILTLTLMILTNRDEIRHCECLRKLELSFLQHLLHFQLAHLLDFLNVSLLFCCDHRCCWTTVVRNSLAIIFDLRGPPHLLLLLFIASYHDAILIIMIMRNTRLTLPRLMSR